MTDSFDLGGKLAVVIGASSGIGAAAAAALARNGARVVLSGRSEPRLEELRVALASDGATDVSTQQIDVRDVAAIGRAAMRVKECYGVPGILVNSMGGTLHKPAMEVTVEDWDQIHETHLRGTFFACQEFARLMRGEGYGKIINMSSTWAFRVRDGRSAYASAKAGLSHLTTALALEWAPYGIRVNAIAPTATRTPRVAQRLHDDPDAEAMVVAGIPLGRLAEPEDIVGSVLFLASTHSDFITGHTIAVDGGALWAK